MHILLKIYQFFCPHIGAWSRVYTPRYRSGGVYTCTLRHTHTPMGTKANTLRQ